MIGYLRNLRAHRQDGKRLEAVGKAADALGPEVATVAALLRTPAPSLAEVRAGLVALRRIVEGLEAAAG